MSRETAQKGFERRLGREFGRYTAHRLIERLAASPDLNPIEEAFSKVKGLLRRAEARTHEALIEAMGQAPDAVSARDAGGFFDHRGYRPMDQLL